MSALSLRTQALPNLFRAAILAGILIHTDRAPGEPATSAPPGTTAGNPCGKALPDDIRRALREKFDGWSIQSPQNLSSTAEERWKSERPRACPGVAKGRFDNTGTASFVVLIVHSGSENAGAKLVLVRGASGEPSSDFKVVQTMESGASNLFIHAVPVQRFFDKKSADKFQVGAPEAILLVDAGKDEYEAGIYFWTGNNYRHEPVDY